jgi:hypothetical protein
VWGRDAGEVSFSGRNTICGDECGVGVEERSGDASTSIGSCWTLSTCCGRGAVFELPPSTGERETEPTDEADDVDDPRGTARSYCDEPYPREVERPRWERSSEALGGEPMASWAFS